MIDKVIELDLSRKKLQQNLEEILFESNTISKEIAEILSPMNQVKMLMILRKGHQHLNLNLKQFQKN